uniref:uncharacterized protein LOC122609445 n=1 Tax=Erigeron canadensis TaxID=72917 RepID=UPI001CB93EE6|nr:uncharacterized protein LOC122609445 [Erigeron canadensis]
MALTKTKRETLCVIFLSFSVCLLFMLSNVDGQGTPYEVLESHNLPIGLLPKGALGYDLDPNSGQFSFNLTKACNIHSGGFKIKYNPTITGVISTNNLDKLDGVRVKIALFWIKIEWVKRNQDNLEFKIGNFAKKSFPVSDFTSSPECS